MRLLPRLCVVAETTKPARAFDLASGKAGWVYESRPGAHLLALDFCPALDRFVALEYAYNQVARDTGPMVALLHLDPSGGAVVLREAIREWSTAVFCANGTKLLNGLGELYDTGTAAVEHVFEVPR